jgi:rod shape-determining protein MreC
MKFLNSKNIRTIILVLVVSGVLFLALSGYLTPIFNLSVNPLISLQSWLSTRFLSARDFLTTPGDVTLLREQNAMLESQVTQLQTQLIVLEEQVGEAQVCFALLDFGRTNPQYNYIAATVIGREISPFLQYIIIDRGTNHGVFYGMPVVTQQGLVGRITAVTASASRVQLISDSQSTVNVSLQNQDEDAIIQGSISGDITLEMLSQNISLTSGDILLTSGLGGNYPADILVGQVVDIKKTENELFQAAYVQPIVDFATLRAVLVITNFQTTNISPLTNETTP